MRRIRTAIVDVGGELPELDLAAAEEWRIVVTDDGVPCTYVVMASPGRAGPGTLALALRRPAERVREERLLRERFRERLGTPQREPAPVRISVVVPTRRRPDVVVGLLGTLANLERQPDEVIVVDNDPGAADCRSVVEAADCTYVREDRRGLNIARRTGLEVATGDVVVFTDDDCLVTPAWLSALPELFADPLVGVVAGPGFARELDTGARLRREEEAGFNKGMARRRFDWRTTRPAHAGVVGSGNSMAFRRDLARELEPFPPELDAGTAAPAAGDLYAIYRVLAAGYDAVYDPRMVFFHRHPATGLRETIRAYGWGAGAYYWKLVVEDRELAVFPLWWWFVRRWTESVLDALGGLCDHGRVRVRWAYFEASLAGPLAWRRSLQQLDEAGRADLERSRASAPHPRLAALLAAREREARAYLGGSRDGEAAVVLDTRDLLPSASVPLLLALDVLERLRLRRTWLRLVEHARRGPEPPPVVIDLADEGDPVAAPADTRARADLRFRGRPVASLTPPFGVWHHAMLDNADVGDRRAWRAAAHAVAGQPSPAPASDLRAEVVAGDWPDVAARVAVSDADVVVVPLPGVEGDERWLADVTAALEGDRVAAVVGAGLADDDPPSPLHLYARAQLPPRFPLFGTPPQFIALRRDLHDRVGAFDAELGALGAQAPLADYLERALAAGLTIGRIDTHGLAPVGTRRPARARGEWERAWARGGLLTREARRAGTRGMSLWVWQGLVPMLRFRRPDGIQRRTLRHAVGSSVAFVLGSLRSGRHPPVSSSSSKSRWISRMTGLTGL